ncbi:hypothetical protein ACFX13_026678 [Malus domestica]
MSGFEVKKVQVYCRKAFYLLIHSTRRQSSGEPTFEFKGRISVGWDKLSIGLSGENPNPEAGASMQKDYYYHPPLGDRPVPYVLLDSGSAYGQVSFWIQGLHMDRVITKVMTGFVAGDRVRKPGINQTLNSI